jgi:hypothetical protein
MDNTQDQLVKLLQELWKAHCLFDSGSRGFDKVLFCSMTPSEQFNYLGGIYGSFFGKEGLDRALIKKGFLRNDFIRDYWPVYQAYVKEIRPD